MTREFPQPGQVFEYHYLWHWQNLQGETAGRKKTPMLCHFGGGSEKTVNM